MERREHKSENCVISFGDFRSLVCKHACEGHNSERFSRFVALLVIISKGGAFLLVLENYGMMRV